MADNTRKRRRSASPSPDNQSPVGLPDERAPKRRRTTPPLPHPCTFPECSRSFTNPAGLHSHVSNTHADALESSSTQTPVDGAQRLHDIVANYLAEYDRKLCPQCHRASLCTGSRARELCTQCKRSRQPAASTPPPTSRGAPSMQPATAPFSLVGLPSLEEFFQRPIYTVDRIPRALRLVCSKLFNILVSRILEQPTDISRHVIFAMAWRLVFAAQARGGKGRNGVRLAKKEAFLRKRMEMATRGDFATLWAELPKPSPRASDDPAMSVKRLAKLGRYSDACKALLSRGVAPDTEEVLQALRDKHPARAGAELSSTPPPLVRPSGEQPDITAALVVKMLGKFKRGSAPGPSGLSADHLKDLLNPSHAGVSKNLTELVAMLASADCHVSVPRSTERPG